MKTLQASLLLMLAVTATACTPLTRDGRPVLSPEEIRSRAVEGKVIELTRRVNAAENKDDTKTQDELRNLRGEIERVRFDLDTQIRRYKDGGADLERRLQKLEAQPLVAAAPVLDASAASVPPPVIYTPPVAAATGATAAEEQAAYLKAFDFLKAGKYDNAISSFQGMLVKWPQGNFADNAWYWLGESQYVKRLYKPALESYSALITRFPASPKVPDALFKSGLTQVELQQPEQAKANWRRVLKDYPNANAAGLARQRLAQKP